MTRFRCCLEDKKDIGKLELQTVEYIANLVIDVKLKKCPPGYIFVNNSCYVPTPLITTIVQIHIAEKILMQAFLFVIGQGI